MEGNSIPLLDCPVDYLVGDASGKIMNEYGRFPCKIKCGVYAFMVRGHAKATINITKYEFNQNDVLLLEPGSFLLIDSFSEDALVYYILFSSAFLEKNAFGTRMSLNSMQLKNPILHAPQDFADVLREMVDLLIKASNTEPSMLQYPVMVQVFNLLHTSYFDYAKKADNFQLQEHDRKSEIYQQYTELVLKHYSEWHHVSQYADALRLTLPHLCSTIKMVSQKTAGDLINEAIITDAKAQLKLSNLQIKEIALSLGFENVAFFNRFFKTKVGVTPKEYRRNG